MKDILPLNIPYYNLRNNYEFQRHNIKSVHYGEESLRYLGPIVWNLVPDDIKSATNLNKFKNSIKSWVPDNCPCRLCKPYLANVGFIS